MIRETINEKFPCLIYWTNDRSRKVRLFFHGHGEHGRKTGEDLWKLEKNYSGRFQSTPPGNAAQGLEYPYTLVCPQGEEGFGNVHLSLIPFMRYSIQATDIFLEGLSEGGMQVMNFLSLHSYLFLFKNQLAKDTTGEVKKSLLDDWEWWKGVVRGAAVMAGKASGGEFTLDGQTITLPDYSTTLDVPVLLIHGTADSSVGNKGVDFMYSKKIYNALTDFRTSPQRFETKTAKGEPELKVKTILLPIENGGHSSSWTNAYSTTKENIYSSRLNSFVDEAMDRNRHPRLTGPVENIRFENGILRFDVKGASYTIEQINQL